eukprot:11182534-Lingulodinium_polyedra.AAC.1
MARAFRRERHGARIPSRVPKHARVFADVCTAQMNACMCCVQLAADAAFPRATSSTDDGLWWVR